jgi:hypothetical protein
MSRKTYFYAAPADTERIHQWLLSEFPGLTLVSQRRGPREHTIPIDASTPGAFWHYPVSCLVPIWAKPLLQVEDLSDRFPDEFIITAQDSPVIEYRPCHWDEATQTVTSSRFYWAYSGELPADAIRQIDKLLRWVQRNTVPVKGPFFRFFPEAQSTACFVRNHLKDKPKPNPFLQEQQLTATKPNS